MTLSPQPRYFSLQAPSFHGATILAALLNNHSAICTTGDGNPRLGIVPRGIPCACGKRIASCEFWVGLAKLRDEFGGPWHGSWFAAMPHPIPSVPRLERACVKAIVGASYLTRQNLLAAFLPGSARRFRESVDSYVRYACAFHAKPIFYDGEKSFSKYVALMSSGYRVDGVVHLVRDPRPYVVSARKRGRELSAAARDWVDLHGRLVKTASWGGRTPVLTVRYEDLTRKPDEVLSRLVTFMGAEPEHLTRPPDKARLHIIGNELRDFNGIPRPADGGASGLTDDEVAVVDRICGPLMRRFGYAPVAAG